jgi:hypothetical protein
MLQLSPLFVLEAAAVVVIGLMDFKAAVAVALVIGTI